MDFKRLGRRISGSGLSASEGALIGPPASALAIGSRRHSNGLDEAPTSAGHVLTSGLRRIYLGSNLDVAYNNGRLLSRRWARFIVNSRSWYRAMVLNLRQCRHEIDQGQAFAVQKPSEVIEEMLCVASLTMAVRHALSQT